VISPEHFARELVERLVAVLPVGFSAAAAREVVHIEAPDGPGGTTSLADLLDRDDLGAEDFASAAWMVLSMAQDIVSETTTEPWPAALGDETELAEPGTRVEGRTLHLYFGAEEQPVLTLEPIVLER
jgi:hypothetical protein